MVHSGGLQLYDSLAIWVVQTGFTYPNLDFMLKPMFSQFYKLPGWKIDSDTRQTKALRCCDNNNSKLL